MRARNAVMHSQKVIYLPDGLDLVETEREKLYQIAAIHGLGSQQALKQSTLLDKLIVDVMKKDTGLLLRENNRTGAPVPGLMVM
jgi:hypothetical protein